MCRLFVYKGSVVSDLTHKMTSDKNSLLNLSKEHCDGWGIAYYQNASPQVIKSTRCAQNDPLFVRTCENLDSKVIVAHIRKATVGEKIIENTHPFNFGPWVFAHNGSIANFVSHKKKFLGHIARDLRPLILGATDSELCFYLILTQLKKKVVNIFQKKISSTHLAESIFETVELITKYAGPLAKTPAELEHGTCLTFILTNGKIVIGYNGGKELFYLVTDKTLEKKRKDVRQKMTIIASVPTYSRATWNRVSLNELIMVDGLAHSLWHYV